MLGWSIKLFRVFGIRLAVHVSFFLLLAYVAWTGWMESRWLGAAWMCAAVVGLFVCVVLHELGHSLTARRFGIRVSRILLLPIGGMAEFDYIPREPRQELLVTAAGPAVNFVLALVTYPFLPVPLSALVTDLFDTTPAVNTAPPTLPEFFILLWVMNLVMGCFNLLPAFPMDGGRILRALLALRWPYLKATFWAATIGKVIAVAAALFCGFVLHAYLPAVLFTFILITGDVEYRAVKRREQAAEQWNRVLRRLYGPLSEGKTDLPSTLLHGPN